MVEIEQSAQTLPPLNVGGQAHRRWRSLQELVVESLVVSLAMVVFDVLAHEETQVPFAALLRGSKTDPQRPLPTDPLTTDSVRRRPTTLSHLIEDVTCEDGLRLLSRPTARSKALPDDQLVPEEGVLHTGLLMVARGGFNLSMQQSRPVYQQA